MKKGPLVKKAIKKERPNWGCRCVDTSLLNEFKSLEGGNTDSGRKFQSLPIEGKKGEDTG